MIPYYIFKWEQSGSDAKKEWLIISDESEPSWLEPELELKDFQLGSACELFHFSSKLKIGKKRAEIHFYHKLFENH